MANNTEHAFKTIGRDIKEAKIRSLAVLFGKEFYLIDWAHELLVNTYVNPVVKTMDYSLIDASQATIDDVINACETLPMMSEKKVVSVKFTADKSKIKESALISYMKDIPSSTLLILCVYSEKISKNLSDAGKSGMVYDFTTLDEKTLSAFIAKEMKMAGKAAKPYVVKEFIHTSGYYQKDSDYTIYNLKNDILKLSAHCRGNEITTEDVEAVTSGNMEKNIFEMVECVCRNRKDEAYRLLHNLLVAGEKPLNIAGMLISQFEILLSIKELRDRAYNASQIQKALKIHEYRLKKAMPLIGRYSVKELKGILLRAYSIDNEIKTGELSGELALEMFIAEI